MENLKQIAELEEKCMKDKTLMTKKEINKLEKIMQDIRDFRDETYCAYSEWQSKGEPDTNENIECTCGIYDDALDKLEEAIKKE